MVRAEAGARRGPLDGVRVVDLTRVLAGPYATMLLGDLGASVIKVEHPKGGDTTRHSAPFKHGQSHYYLAVNRNKKSVAIDVTTPRGRELVLDLCRDADVLVENFRPGTMERIGLDDDALRSVNPALILCSISGFGRDGPLRDRLAYDIITQAISGVLSTNGEPAGPPVRISIPIGDLTGGLLAAIGILAALRGRDRGQPPRHVDVALHDGLVSLLGYMATLYDATGSTPRRTGSRHPSVVPYGTFRTKDGWLAIAIFTSKFWQLFCAAVGREDLAADPRYRRTQDRMANRVELERLVEEIVAERTTAAWEELLERSGVPASAIFSVPEALEHPQTQARGMFPMLSHPEYGDVRVPGPPLRLGGEGVDRPVAPPVLGEHTAEVLRDVLAVSDAEIAELERAGVIRVAAAASATGGAS
ncbi:MAG TPA: CaiB/BaiF CoA-transferase family protein [Candidatus Dormibacteraeota bacterium]|nr:CaiB/BaiF CoA-transferase family protein [Candidatus Dormibacteraeota bacterium]